ncbi:MAG: hypothetical protein MJY63_01250 [Paludibacteraceae bacterium]|nr:hypothetical protein [Paludibacteraceae bacterium]
MWKRGKELVLHSSTIATSDRIRTNLSGSIGFILNSVVGLVFILYYFKNNSTTDNVYVIIIPLAIMGCLDYIIAQMIYSSYFPKDNPITIGESGIMIHDGTLYKWHDIEYAYYGFDETEISKEQQMLGTISKATVTILSGLSKISKNDSKTSKKEQLEFLHVIYKDAEGEINHVQYELSGYVYKVNEISSAVEYWSRRDIGEKTDVVRHEYIQKLVDDGDVKAEDARLLDERISCLTPLFNNLHADQFLEIVRCIPILLVALGITILLDIETCYDGETLYRVFKYVAYVFGPVCVYVSAIIYRVDKKLKEFKQKPEIKNLSEAEFDEYSAIASNKKPLPDSFFEIFLYKIYSVIVYCLVFAWFVYVIFLVLYRLKVVS